MDRDGFVEFVQWTFVERNTKGSKVVTRSRNAEITAYLTVDSRSSTVGLCREHYFQLHLIIL